MSVRTDVINLNVNINGDAAKDQLNRLRTDAAKITAEMKSLKKGTEEWIKKSDELKLVNDKIASLRSQMGLTVLSQKELTEELRRLQMMKLNLTPQTKEFKDLQNQIDAVQNRLKEVRSGEFGFKKFWSSISSEVKQFGMLAAGYLGFDFVIGQTKNLIQMQTKMADEYSNIEKTTSLTKDQIKELDQEMRKFDTRSSNSRLRQLAAEAGKLGKDGVEDIRKFVEQADKIDVALGEDLGDEGLNKIAKISGILNEEMINIASGINAVGAASAASEGYQVDFAFRMAGAAQTARMAAGDLFGYAAALEVNGQTAEVSGTAMSNFLLDFIANTETFGKAAGYAKGQLVEMINGEGVNAAFLAWLQKMKDSSKTQAEFIEKMNDVGIDGARGAGVFLVLANNIKQVQEQQALANKAVAEGTSVLEEFDTKNNNFAATVDKLKKEFAGLFTSKTINDAIISMMEGVIGLINGIRSLSDWIGKHKLVLAAWSIAGLLQVGVLKKLITWITLQATETRALTLIKWGEVAAENAQIIATTALGAAKALLRLNLVKLRQEMLLLFRTININPFAALLAVVGALYLAYQTWTDNVSKLTEKQIILKSIQDQVNEATNSQISKVQQLTSKVYDNNLSLDERKRALNELIAINPSYLNGLTLENIKTAQGTAILNQYVEALKRKAKAQAVETEIEKAYAQKLANAQKKLAYDVDPSLAKKEYRDLTPTPFLSSVGDAIKYGTWDPERELMNKRLEESDEEIDKKISFLSGIRVKDLEAENKARNENVRVLKEQLQQAQTEWVTKKRYFDMVPGSAKKAFDKIAELKRKIDIASNQSLDNVSDNLMNSDLAGGNLKTPKEKKKGKSDAEKAAEKAAKEKEQELKRLVDELKKIQGDIEKKSAEAKDSLSAMHSFELQDLTAKYAERMKIAMKHGRDYVKLVGNLSDQELALLNDKQKKEMDKANYADSLKNLETYINSETNKLKQQYADGLIDKKTYEKELKLIDADEFEGRLSLAKHFAETVKEATADGEKLKTEEVERGIKKRTEIEEKAQRSSLAYLRYQIAAAPEGSLKQLDAKKRLLEEERRLRIKNEELTQEELEELDLDFKKKKNDLDKEYWTKQAQQIISVFAGLGDLLGNIFSMIDNREQAQLKASEDRDKKRKASLDKMLNGGAISQKKYDAEMAKIESAADARDSKYQMEKAKRDKAAAIFNAIINTAQGVVVALGSAPPPYNIILAAITAAAGAVQIASLKSQAVPRGRKGLIIQGPSHEANGIDMVNGQTGERIANIEGGEPVIVLSKRTYANNKDTIDALIESSQYKNGAKIRTPDWYMAPFKPFSQRIVNAARSMPAMSDEAYSSSGQANNERIQQMEQRFANTDALMAEMIEEQRLTRAAILKDRNRRSYVVLKDMEEAQRRKDRAKMLSGIR